MKLTIEQTKLANQIFADMENLDWAYITGDAGTGKTVLAQHIADVAAECGHVIKCSPIGKIADMIEANGRTLQSVFHMGGKTVLPEEVTYYPGFKGRTNVNVIAQRVAKDWGEQFKLQKGNVFIYIEECMAASAEELHTVKEVLQILRRDCHLNFFVLCVGHPIQQVRNFINPQHSRDKVVCYEYDTKAFMPPQYCNGMKDGTPIVVTKEPFFTSTDGWVGKEYRLHGNIRQAGDEAFSSILKDIVDSNLDIVDDLCDLLGNRIITVKEGELVPEVDTYLTPSVKVENYFNSLVLSPETEGVVTYLPYIDFDGLIKGYVSEYKNNKVKIDDDWHDVPAKYIHDFREAWNSMPVPINNRMIDHGKVLVRENSEFAKNGAMGTISGLTNRSVNVCLATSDSPYTVTYVQSKAVPMCNGEYIFKLQYLPIMSSVAITTGKIQGWTADSDVNIGICIDATNRNPRPHSFYVALSRATSLEQVYIIVSNATDDVDLSTVLTNYLQFDKDCYNFHHKIELTKPNQLTKTMTELNTTTETKETVTETTTPANFKVVNADEYFMSKMAGKTGTVLLWGNKESNAGVTFDDDDYEETIEETEEYAPEADINPSDYIIEDSEKYEPEADIDPSDYMTDDEKEETVEEVATSLEDELLELNETLTAELEEKDNAIAERNEAIANLKELCKQLQATVAQQEVKAEQQDKVIANQKEELTSMTKELANRDAKIAELEAKGLTPEKLGVLTQALSILTELGLAPQATAPITPTENPVIKEKVVDKETTATTPAAPDNTAVEDDNKSTVVTITIPKRTKVCLDTTVNGTYLRSFVLGLRKYNVELVTDATNADIVLTDSDLGTSEARKETLMKFGA